MKVLLLTLLLLLCSTQVLTLKCFTCEGEGDDICKRETECPASAQYCKAVVRAGEIVSRTCEELCDENYFTTCCQEDFC